MNKELFFWNIKNITNVFWNKLAFQIAFIYWTIINSTNMDKLFFKYDNVSLKIIFLKILHLIFIYFLTNIIIQAYRNKKINWVKHAIYCSGIYFAFLFVGLLMTWPGTWCWDDVFVLQAAQNYRIEGWQHILTSVYQILALQTLPFSAGVIIIQIIIISMIVGYCVAKITSLIFRNEKKYWLFELIILIVLLMPPLLIHIYSGFRIGLYSYLELLLIVKMFEIYRQDKSITLNQLSWICFLTVIVSTWRTEGFYYVIALPLLFIMLSRKKISYFKVFISSIIIIILFANINKINNEIIGNNNYSITATILPVVSFVKQADKIIDQEELKGLDHAIDINVIYNNPNVTGEDLYWSYGLVRSSYTNKDYSNYMQAYVKLIFKHPGIFLKAVGKNFYSSSGLDIDKNGYSAQRNIVSSATILFEGSQGEVWASMNSLWSKPIDSELRNKVLLMLGSVNADGVIKQWYRITWNLFIPLLMLVIVFFYELFVDKKLFLALLLACVICRMPLIMITSPAPYFMYYLPIYLMGYFAIILFCLKTIEKREGKRTKKSICRITNVL